MRVLNNAKKDGMAKHRSECVIYYNLTHSSRYVTLPAKKIFAAALDVLYPSKKKLAAFSDTEEENWVRHLPKLLLILV